MTTPAEDFAAFMANQLGRAPQPAAVEVQPPPPPVVRAPAPNMAQGHSGNPVPQYGRGEEFGLILDQLRGELPPAGSGGWITISEAR